MMDQTILSIVRSWSETNHCMHELPDILEWIRLRNETVTVDIKKSRLEDSDNWYYSPDEGCIRNKSGSFFKITGIRRYMPGEDPSDPPTVTEQPIILQPEIGYLGIICKEFDGIMHFLMQAKIEPGNVNKIQISPTIQATKSNFTRKHGGNAPAYLEYFLDTKKYEVVVDQIQSEQASRFYKKRNRNIIIRVEDDIPVLQSHMWMTLGQIKQLMHIENLVNMDTRTVLSCIPYERIAGSDEAEAHGKYFGDRALYRSIFRNDYDHSLRQIYHYINDRKMFDESRLEFIPLHELENWEWKDDEFVCKKPYPFSVVFCDIEIEGREVRKWSQPLIKAAGIATFGLLMCEDKGVLKFVIKAKPEIGSFDVVELGPTVQREAVTDEPEDEICRFFMDLAKRGEGVVFDNLLSEEGGRFLHEQNRNILIRTDIEKLPELPEGYFLVDFRTLNDLVQINNMLNIQLRNLLSLLEA